MPYVDKECRARIDNGSLPMGAGELNYAITALLVSYVRFKDLKYSTINDVLGALEGAKLEFYRRVAVPYETAKIAENGDVYP